jgi:hypothetical protein
MTSVLIQAYGDKSERDRTLTGDRTAALAAKRDFLRRLKISLPRKAGIVNGEENTSQMEGKK